MALPSRCKSCVHFFGDTSYKDYDMCIYRLDTYQKRPCPISPHCTVYEPKTKRKRWNNTPRREYIDAKEEMLCYTDQSLDLSRLTARFM